MKPEDLKQLDVTQLVELPIQELVALVNGASPDVLDVVIVKLLRGSWKERIAAGEQDDDPDGIWF